ncbi:uncharacterized protein [Branchiostoma lanceolatum]|uniref:uncharacterized protein n=1 Tax=Branchiostoma lanceolatum TaxID=7740 RepID=UPI003454F3C3
MLCVLVLLLAIHTVPDTFATAVQRAGQITMPWATTTTTEIVGCISSYDGQGRPPGSTYYPDPAGSGDCFECTCDRDPWSNTAQENCRCRCWCYCLPCVDAISGRCCPTCPNGANCNAMGTVIPAGRDVEVNGHTCRCQHDTEFPPPHGKRSALAGKGSLAYGCEPFLEAICDPIITG